MQQNIKTEPIVDRPKWSLIAVSEAARKHHNMFSLNVNKTYSVGRSSSNDIHLPTTLCSKRHCQLIVTDDEIIIKDESTHGTRVNRMNYKNSRCIVNGGDLLGFGCSIATRHLKDKQDTKYYVYRVSEWTDFGSITIELSDDSDQDEGQNMPSNRYSNGFCVDGNDTDDEFPSEDEQDIKPDIHTLMRLNQEKLQIKEEINWNAYDYDRIQNETNKPYVWNDDPIYLDSDDEDVVTVEPPRKKIRSDTPTSDKMHAPPREFVGKDDYLTSNESEPTVNHVIHESTALPEYQMSNATLKEKVKLVVRSRGQQLATDMLMSQRTLNTTLNDNGTVTKPMKRTSDENAASSSAQFNSKTDHKSIQNMTNIFISEITKWDYQWIYDKKSNPLQYMLDVRQLDTNFSDLTSFQRQMKSLLLMEVYSIIFTEYSSKTQPTFTQLDSCYFESDIKRYVYKCSTKKNDCHVSEISPGDFTIVKHGKGNFLAFVTKAQRISDGAWAFEMQASKIDRDANNIKCKFIQVSFMANIQTMLECFVSLYELQKSSLLEVFLRPSKQFEDEYDPVDDEFKQADWASILAAIYEKCAKSIVGNPRILLVNGGCGTGKTTFIYDLLQRFASEDFQFTSSILVCGRNNTLVDTMAAKIAQKIKNIARFGKISTMRKDVRSIGVEKPNQKLQQVNIVFITLNNAVDLLHANRAFDVCIVDDASLCSEAELLPLFRLRLTTLLLVGDSKLQTSTTQNECCRENGYSRSLFTRAIASYTEFDSNKTLYPTLYKQRRMNVEIASWPNTYFYNKTMALAPIARPQRSPFKAYTVLQVNTIEDIEMEFVKQMLDFCMKQFEPRRCTCGIICGNPSSKEAIEQAIKLNVQFTGIEVSEYDSFQGREKDVILMIALKPIDGFQLFSTRENLLIALTRAKESLILCGNFQHVYTHIDAMTSTWNAILDDAKQKKRFFDTNGTFDEKQINYILTK